MTPQQIVLVQESWKQVVPIKDKAAELFYGKLFEMDPNVQSLFEGDMVEQGKKLMTMINAAVAGLSRVEAIVPVVQELGKRHAGYGVKDADYDTVGSALLWTLEAGLGPAFTPEVKDAWGTVYGVLAGTMKDAAKG